MYYQSLLLPSVNSPEYLATQTIEPLEGKTSISIDQVHILQHELSLSVSTKEKRTIAIIPANALTMPAQQALLKTLEEPPHNTQIILVTDTPNALLPTILSRCEIRLERSENKTKQVDISFRSYSEAIKHSDTYASKREEAILFVKEVITSETNLEIKRQALETLSLLYKNINVKLCLDQFFFKTMSVGAS
ncbi:MAG: hypothetical protein ABI758_05335 [Candidatus Woesebacteria bacterium]